MSEDQSENIQHGYVLAQDNQKVFYDHYCHDSDKVVIIAHGFFNSKDAVLLKELGQELLDEGYDVIIMDFRGHGESPGMFYWTTKEYLDLTAILEYAHKQYRHIGVIGFSLGAATSIITAARTDLIHSLIAISPPTEFKEIEYHFWELDYKQELLYSVVGKGRYGKGVRPGPFWLKKDKPIECIAHVKTPTLFLHGDDDWVIRHRHSEALFEKATCEKRLVIVPNGPHAEYLIQRNKEQTLSPIKKWLSQTL